MSTLISKFTKKLESKDELLTIDDLVEVGLYDSHSSARSALRRGDIPSLKISRHRTLIDRDDLIRKLHNNFDHNAVNI